ncbi:MAG: molybdenum cofactor biosynthesis protein MoaE [Propionibacteriaceae bacterium]|jgi:molybdopterin synthase catalytic subunit|nr:molybdenum cofactor biosynthesis protein MoaE [Propionibacteriaceae bacterium]
MTALVRWATVGPAVLDPAALEAVVRQPAAGAVVTFSGVVRHLDGGRTVTGLEYEAHPEAGSRLLELLRDWSDAWPTALAVAVGHRVGRLAVGEVAFAASVAAAHRGEAFAACAALVDLVKLDLPIWKLQHFGDGASEWVNLA